MEWIYKSTVIFAGAALVNTLLRRHSAALRHHVWLVAFALLAVVPFLQRIAAVRTTAFTLAAISPAASSAVKSTPVDWLPLLWSAGAVILLARLVLAYWHAARLAVTPSPVLCGLFRPRIIWPEEANGWDSSLRTAVELHESAHIARRDPWAQLLIEIVTACYWWQPLIWWARSKALEDRERACDDRVLEHSAPAAYAAALVTIARGAAALSPATLGTVQLLERRLRAMLNPNLDRSRVGFRRGLLITLVLGASLGAAGLVTAAPDQVHKVGGDTRAPRLIHKVEPGYTERTREAKINGTVKLAVRIDSRGRVAAAIVTESLHPDLDAQAIKAVEQWTFEPATRKGQPVAVDAAIHVNFRLY